MSFLVHTDGRVVLSCASCRAYLSRDGRTASCCAADAEPEELERAFREADEAMALAERAGWRRSARWDAAWLCPACASKPKAANDSR